LKHLLTKNIKTRGSDYRTVMANLV